MNRADLQALIDYTGLSIREAAELIGIGHEALSRKLAGKPRYEARAEELSTLGQLAAAQDRFVTAALAKIDELAAHHGEPDKITIVVYRRDHYMAIEGEPPTRPELPYASAARQVAARIKHMRPEATELVAFDPVAYHAWRQSAGRVDSRQARAEWAALMADARVPSRIVLEFADASAGSMMLPDQAARSMI